MDDYIIIHNSKDYLKDSLELIENKINKTIATIIWINKRENKFLAQALKNQDKELEALDKIAKGAIKINILISIYLKE